jgi:membrane-associated protease RseP (regulator of RpoE activity)
MTFSGDGLEAKSNWSKTRSNITLALIVLVLLVMVIDPQSRGYALMGIGLMITIMLHETGHFIAAKKTGMKASEFFVGFGPRIWSFKKGETEYGIKAIPLGGYVKIIGMTNLDEIEKEDEARTYRAQKTWKKLVVILAGITVNIILAFLLIYVSLVFRGVPQSAQHQKATVEVAQLNSPADKAGIKPDDVISKIDDIKTPTFEKMRLAISDKKVGDKVVLTIQRDGKTITKTVKVGGAPDEKGKATNRPFIGVQQKTTEYEKVGALAAVTQTGKSMYRIIDLNVGSIMDRFSYSGLKDYSKVVANGSYERADRPSSVVGIVDQGGALGNIDPWYIVFFMAIINLFLALFNVLPLLPLDGGHAAVAIYEGIGTKIKKRPVVANFKKLMPIAVVVVGAFATLALSSIWLDILQIAS